MIQGCYLPGRVLLQNLPLALRVNSFQLVYQGHRFASSAQSSGI